MIILRPRHPSYSTIRYDDLQWLAKAKSESDMWINPESKPAETRPRGHYLDHARKESIST